MYSLELIPGQTLIEESETSVTTYTTLDVTELGAQQDVLVDDASVNLPGGVVDEEFNTLSLEVEQESDDGETLGTITLSVQGECDEGGVCTKEVSGLEKPVCFELGASGGENIKCTYFNESTGSYEQIEGETTDPT